MTVQNHLIHMFQTNPQQVSMYNCPWWREIRFLRSVIKEWIYKQDVGYDELTWASHKMQWEKLAETSGDLDPPQQNDSVPNVKTDKVLLWLKEQLCESSVSTCTIVCGINQRVTARISTDSIYAITCIVDRLDARCCSILFLNMTIGTYITLTRYLDQGGDPDNLHPFSKDSPPEIEVMGTPYTFLHPMKTELCWSVLQFPVWLQQNLYVAAGCRLNTVIISVFNKPPTGSDGRTIGVWVAPVGNERTNKLTGSGALEWQGFYKRSVGNEREDLWGCYSIWYLRVWWTWQMCHMLMSWGYLCTIEASLQGGAMGMSNGQALIILTVAAIDKEVLDSCNEHI
ncbi:hypothetical protein EDD18DRAFT_1111007 [Armillaria luteobubalina]|uniref:Uncharacterized protein n=1 Tax=Armillaria luteobubalina TaxID=153913 RepID=A0AA39PM65_9AGAR|nr:hypothetical protein EDD18DRAFT_1111007 [Armillaria luteobubalina]